MRAWNLKKRALSLAIGSALFLNSLGAQAEKTVLTAGTYEVKDGVTLYNLDGDTSIFEIRPFTITSGSLGSTSGRVGTLIVDGILFSSKGNAIIDYVGRNDGFSIFLDENGKIQASKGVDGILVSEVYSGSQPSGTTTRFDLMELVGSIFVIDTGSAIRIKNMSEGIIYVEDIASVYGNTGILAEGLGGLTDNSYIVSGGNITGSGGNAIDFSRASNKLQAWVWDGLISGDIRGIIDKTIQDDQLVITGGVINGNIWDVEKISNPENYTVRTTGTALARNPGNAAFTSSVPHIKGSIRHTDGTSKTQLDILSDLKLGNGESLQILDVNLKQSKNSQLMVVVPTNNAVTSLQVTGTTEFEDGAIIQVVVPESIFTDQNDQFVTYTAIESTSAIVNEAGIVVSDSILTEARAVDADGATKIDLEVRARPVGEVEQLISSGGGGASSGSAIDSILDDMIQTLKQHENSPGSVSADQLSAARNVYKLFSGISNPQDLLKVARGSRVNNADSTQASNVILSSATQSQLSTRMENIRDSGRSFGDDLSSDGFWMQFLRSDATQDDRTNDTGDKMFGFDADIDGASLGYERSYTIDDSEWLSGVALTMATAAIKKHSSSDHSSVRNYQLSLYNSWDRNDWFIDTVFNYGRSNHKRSRYVNGVLQTPIKADFISNHYGLFVQGGKQLQFEGINWQPMLGFNYTRIESEGYTEKDSALSGFAQKVDDQTYQKVELGLGIELSKAFQVGKGILEPSVNLMAWHDVKGEQIEVTSRYLFGSQSFTVKGADAVKNSYQAGVNINYYQNNNMSLTVGYQRNQKSDYVSNNYYFRMKYEF